MDQNYDLLLLAIYLIVVTYVIFQAFNSLDDRTFYSFDKASLEKELEEKKYRDTPLKDLVGIGPELKDDNRFSFSEQPADLTLKVENKSKHLNLSIDWDNSTVTNYKTQAGRAIRVPDAGLEGIPQTQVKSSIAPGTNTKVKITREDLLVKPEGDDKIWKPKKPLIDIDAVKKESKSKDKKTKQSDRDRYDLFMTSGKPLEFTLILVMKLTDLEGEGKGELYRLPCHFQAKRVSILDHLPWVPKK